jgi:hypothetical protein
MMRLVHQELRRLAHRYFLGVEPSSRPVCARRKPMAKRTASEARRTKLDGSGTVVPFRENVMLSAACPAGIRVIWDTLFRISNVSLELSSKREPEPRPHLNGGMDNQNERIHAETTSGAWME